MLKSLLVVSLVIAVVCGNVVPDWRKDPMIFPCGDSRNQHRGEGGAMIFDCRGKTGDGAQGAGPNGGQGGISVVETNVASKGMAFVPDEPPKNNFFGKNSGRGNSFNRLQL